MKRAEIKVTPFVVRVLRAVEEGAKRCHGKPRARFVAQELWPESKGWQRVCNVGTHGAARGVGPPRRAGMELWRLERAGLLRHRLEFGVVHGRGKKVRQGVVAEWWEVTAEGRKVLSGVKQ